MKPHYGNGSPMDREPVIERVLDGLAQAIPLTVICRGDGMPTDNTIRDWARDDEALAEAIARARETGFDLMVWQCFDIAKDKSREPQCRKVEIDTILKIMSKWDPKRYGDKIETLQNINMSVTKVERVLVDPATPNS